MLTLKRYWNPTEAALDRTLLANYNVFCSLFDEHVNALGYFNAMPIRLMVADEQLERAGRLLETDTQFHTVTCFNPRSAIRNFFSFGGAQAPRLLAIAPSRSRTLRIPISDFHLIE